MPHAHYLKQISKIFTSGQQKNLGSNLKEKQRNFYIQIYFNSIKKNIKWKERGTHLVAASVRIALFLGVLQPFNKVFHLINKHHLAFDVVVLLVPHEYHLLGYNVSFVKKHDDLLESPHKGHVRVAELLHLQEQGQLRL